MSVVDTWNWDKLELELLEYTVVNSNIKVQEAIYNFERNHGIHPNRIIMGFHLSNKLYAEFSPIINIEEVMDIKNKCRMAAYEGIPVEIDMNNPNRLCVGYMEECCWSKEYE